MIQKSWSRDCSILHFWSKFPVNLDEKCTFLRSHELVFLNIELLYEELTH